MERPLRPRLLYVEDEQEMADIAVEVLSDDFDVTHFADAEAALTAALRLPFDVMVVDRRLPGMDGTELVAKIRRAGLTTPVLLLTALGAVQDRVEGLDGGANDYLVKPFDFDELRARLRALMRGYQSQMQRREIGEWTFVPGNDALVGPYGQVVTLTEVEAKVLGALSAHPDHVFSRAEILAACFPSGEAESTVDSYVHYIRRKSAPELIRTVRARGYQIGGAE